MITTPRPTKSEALTHLSTLLPSTDFLTPSSPSYALESQTWAIHRNYHPSAIIRPTSIDSLSKTVKYLATTDLEYKVRSRGFGSASAKDVLISMTAFDGFKYDKDKETVTLGVGGNWGMYYERMEKVEMKKTIVAARTPSIGIGGSTLCSGFSWLSHEYGCVSDASNLLDAQIVLADGTVTWASLHPDLFWAMRGTEGGFAIATKFVFSVKHFEENGKIWAGPILLPRSQTAEVARRIARMCGREDVHPKVAMFLYVMKKEMLKLLSGGDGAGEDMLVVHAYDGLGEEHGRREFGWALDIEGAVDMTRSNMTMKEVCAMQEQLGSYIGKTSAFWTPMAISKLTEEHVVNSFAWWDEVGASKVGTVGNNPNFLLELFSCRDNLTARASSAWPRPVGFKHMLLLGTGCDGEGTQEERDEAKRLIKDVAPRQILGEKGAKEMIVIPNGVEGFHDHAKMYGEHWPRLRQIKAKYDPDNRLGGWVPPS